MGSLDKFMGIHDLNMDENLLGSQPLINECAPNEIAEKIKQLGIIKVSVHTPVYTMHKFWARRPWGVFRKIILSFTKPGDVILDPYTNRHHSIEETGTSQVNPATGLEDERTPTEHLLIMVRNKN
jgi:hypothetical protein